MAIQAIETHYKGCRFRSRLEARWAVWLDSLRLRWQYEPQGYVVGDTPYLPDFWLPAANHKHPGAGYWLEIKPIEPSQSEKELLLGLTLQTGHNGYLLAGNIGVGEFVTYKSICVRERAAVEHYAGHELTDMISTTGTGVHDGLCAVLVASGRSPGGLSWYENLIPITNIWIMSPLAGEMSVMALDAAFRAARSARFEHGETPRP